MNPLTHLRTILTAFLTMLVLSGCATRYVDRVVVETKYVTVAPDAKYLEPTAVPAPPTRKTYTGDERPDFETLYKETVLHSTTLYKSIQSCNADKFGASADILKKKKAYE